MHRPTLGRRAKALEWKAADSFPRLSTIGAALKSVLARSEVKNARVAGIDRQPFTHSAAFLIAAHVEGDGESVPRLASIARAKNRRRLLAIHARGDVDDAGI